MSLSCIKSHNDWYQPELWILLYRKVGKGRIGWEQADLILQLALLSKTRTSLVLMSLHPLTFWYDVPSMLNLLCLCGRAEMLSRKWEWECLGTQEMQFWPEFRRINIWVYNLCSFTQWHFLDLLLSSCSNPSSFTTSLDEFGIVRPIGRFRTYACREKLCQENAHSTGFSMR